MCRSYTDNTAAVHEYVLSRRRLSALALHLLVLKSHPSHMPFPGCRRGNTDVPLPSPSLPLFFSQLGVSALTDAHCNQLPRPSTAPISDGTGVDKRQLCSLPQMTSHTGELSSGLRFVIFVCAHAWCVAYVERPETTVYSQFPHSTFTGAEGMVPGLDSKCL